MFVMGYSVEISLLVCIDCNDLFLIERFELFVGCWELVNGYSELNDFVVQWVCFEDE